MAISEATARGAVGSAMIGRAAAGAVCIAVEVPTVGMGTLACGVLVAAAASTVGAAYGEQGREFMFILWGVGKYMGWLK